MILLNPGPVKLSAGVRAALTGSDLCHREPEFANLQTDIRRRLLEAYDLSPDRWAAIMLAGSGTAAVEAMLASSMPRNGKLLTIENGVYGERMTRIAVAHDIPHHPLQLGWRAAININEVARVLEIDPNISHVAVVHHETTTGRLNDLIALTDLCRRHSVQVLIDAVSSFGAEAVNFADAIAGCAATANKCLHGAPGVSFVIARRDQLSRGAAPRSVYLDLATYCREQDRSGTPFTQPVHIFYALRRALIEFEEQGGWRARRRRYLALAQQLSEGFEELGIQALLPRRESSAILRAYYLPKGLSYADLHDALKARNFVIYAGQGELARSIFRVAVMGAIEDGDIDRLLRAFQAIISEHLT